MRADIVFLNGEVITVNALNEIAEGVAVKDNEIIAVGFNEEIETFIGENTEVVDLNGKSLLPGFIDAHLHLTIYGTNLLGVSCSAPHINSLPDLFGDLKKRADETEKGEWIRAWGFNEHSLADKRFPTREELDEITRDHPMVITRMCNHISVVNSKALEMAGIHEETPEPDGGIIERDSKGKLTGKLIENAHMELFHVASFSDEELQKAHKLASDTFIQHGITSIHDAGGYGKGPDILRVMQKGVQSGDIKVRVYAMIGSLTDSEGFIEKMLDSGVVTGLGDDKFKIGPAKLFTDGSSTGPTIATREPYSSDANNYGIKYYEQDKLNEILGKAHKNGFQITAHAQGDRAVEMVINCIEEAVKNHPREDHRHRIEHAGVTPPDLQARMQRLNIIPIPNPAFIFVNGDSYIHNYGERVNSMYPAKDYLDHSIIAAFASDSPVVGCDPLLGIHAAVNRKTTAGQPAGANQCIEVMDAIRSYTYNGAYASFDEDIKGSIEVGKFADMVVLDRSILQAEKEHIINLKVELTMVDGEVLYRKEAKVSS
ncbi:amidohydrolase 3 [Bacillus freudenreichii]|nr:amidohydrolase 3 [Bacillus freudenreichii]